MDMIFGKWNVRVKIIYRTGSLLTVAKEISKYVFYLFIWFVRLLALRPLLAYCASPGDSEDDCGEADGI
jgi:hypothetical protein